jgi:DNA-binding IclR family transcriptional regulator
MELLARQPMRATDAAEALGMSWATLYRVLTQLEADEFIVKDAGGVYRIGRRTWLLGSTYLVGHRLLELAVPVMKQAATEVPHAVIQLVERSESSAVVLYSQEGASGDTITRTTYGYHFPLHTGSKGQLLLAYAPPEFIDHYLASELIALTPQSVTEPDAIRERLSQIRKDGYAVTVGDVQSFTGSVATPVFDTHGEVVAAICAVATRADFGGEREQALLQVAQRVAQTISLGTGWRPMVSPRAHV